MKLLKKTFNYSLYKTQSMKNVVRHRFGFGGSGISKELKDWIWENIPKGEIVVELGAGLVSTRILSKRFKLFSVEENSNYVGLYPKAHYVHSKIDAATQWYSLRPDELPQKFFLLIIDGPSGSHLRKNVLNCDWIFERCQIIIVDDTWRDSESILAQSITYKVKGSIDQHKAFTVIRKKEVL